jgi:putative sigma-54 modulation protein
MKINYTARNAEITPQIKKYCERRMNSLEKLVGYPIEADLLLAQEKYRHKVDINIKTKGGTLNSQEETQDMLSSLGVAFDNIEKRVKKEKDKLKGRKRRRAREPELEVLTEETEKPVGKIIRTREFTMKPQSVEEALMLMESRRYNVYMFRKFDSEKWAVLYRRKDKNFGLIDPEE